MIMERSTARPRKPAKQPRTTRPAVLAASSTDPGYGRRRPAKVKAPKAQQQQQRPKRRGPGKARHCYWLTPKAWRRWCSHCGHEGAAAYRPRDRKYACEDCIAKLGINAHESKSWRDGGGRAGSKVTVRHVDPATLR